MKFNRNKYILRHFEEHLQEHLTSVASKIIKDCVKEQLGFKIKFFHTQTKENKNPC